MVNVPSANASDYFVDEDEFIPAKNGTTVQSGWAAAEAFLKPKKESAYAMDLRITETPQLVRFLDDEPFYVYEQHWINRSEGKRSFVCLKEECPLCTIAGDKPTPRFVFNVVVLTDEEPSTQLLTASRPLARILLAANEDPRRGPLSKYFWSISRQGTGPSTAYGFERVKAVDLAEEWQLDIESVEENISSASRYDQTAIYTSPRDELLTLARTLVGAPVIN
jgi:hypothetical protein